MNTSSESSRSRGDGSGAGRTNAPDQDGPDPDKAARGALPVMLAQSRSAREAAQRFVEAVEPGRYNPAHLLVGDRDSLFYLELPAKARATSRELGPGLHVLENVPLDQTSSKVTHVRTSIDQLMARGSTFWDVAPNVLSSHAPVDPQANEPLASPGRPRPPATLSACVHTEGYGTRSASLIRVSARATALPEIRAANGPPCTHEFIDVTSWWSKQLS